MKIGIIGSGNIGTALAKFFVGAGHEVAMANSRGPLSLQDLAAEIKVEPSTVEDVVKNKDVVIIAITEQGVLNLSKDIFSKADSRTIFVDTGNYYPEVRDARIDAIENGMLESVWVSKQLGIPIIKAFNSITIFGLTSKNLPAGSPGRLCISVAGDNSQHKQVIMQLIDEVGFDCIDAGVLADSWKQQPGAPAYCNDLEKAALVEALQHADRSNIAEYRADAINEAKRLIAAAGSLDAAVANAGRL
jgi:predicted dinucleotide-binding enzyme